ncbi:hypothetical protein ACS0TY_017069 [Phlomoides rotata]
MITISYKFCIYVFLVISSSLFKSDGADTLSNYQIFRDNGTTLISSGGSFEFGFFSPENSKNRYVGIWYKKITVRTVVWVANREIPLKNGSGVLKVVEPGLLVLVNGTTDIIWSTNTSRNVKSPVAQLLDSGNLVVKDASDDNPENFLWQSFHYPTDTLLPGMKHGWDFKTGLEVYLTSQKSSDDPAPGDFTFHCDPNGYPQCVTKMGGAVRYKPGPWNGVSFSGIPTLQQNTIFTYEMVINEDEVYYRYGLVNDSVIARFTLSESGVGKRWVWVDRKQEWISYLTMPLDNCDVYDACGPYGSCNIRNSPACGCLNKFKPKDPQARDRGDWSNGCVRSTPLDCQKGDAFLKYSGIKLPDTQHSWYNKSTSLEECRLLCSKNCSCTAYATQNISRGEHGCLLWFEDLVDIREISPGQDIYIKMASSELDSEGRKRGIRIVTLSLVFGIVLLCLCLSIFLCFQKRKNLDPLREAAWLGLNSIKSHEDLELPLFPLSTIIKATDNFSIKNKLGEGGFGPVYKGLLEEGQEIAVKCLSQTSHQGVEEFKNEVICIAKLQHRNLVKLLGWSLHGEELMLVYEYMPNKSLDLILFDQDRTTLLDWPTRFNIITSVARGLIYLHQDSRLRVIHRDLKASNILLDSYMNPKISDFGLARTLGGNETGSNTRRVVGTYGYMSPEYATHGLFSVKSDVFSFGVIVLEIVTGKRNKVFSHSDHHLDLLGHAWMLYREGRSSELVDACFRNSLNLSEVVRSIHIGLLCVQEHPEDRPSMPSVVQMLGNDNALPESKYPGFFTGIDELKRETSSNNTAFSTNPMSITLPEAR